jgi:carbon monoxide dehydrogenase subunit G
MNAWIQLKEVNKNDTRMKLTLKADMPAMIKMMAGNKIEEGINKLADVLAATLNSKL